MDNLKLFLSSKYNKIWLLLSLVIGVVIFILHKKGKFNRGFMAKVPKIALILFPVSLFLKKFIVKQPTQ